MSYFVIVDGEVEKEIRREFDNFVREVDAANVPSFMYKGQPMSCIDMVSETVDEWADGNSEQSFENIISAVDNSPYGRKKAQDLTDIITSLVKQQSQKRNAGMFASDPQPAKEAMNRIVSSYMPNWQKRRSTNEIWAGLIYIAAESANKVLALN